MEITEKQLKGRPKKIGSLGDSDVYEAVTKGGLYVVMAKVSGSKTKTLGTGSHRATARHLAEKQNPDLKISDLSKSEQLGPEELRYDAQNHPFGLATLVRMQAMEK